MLSYIKSEFYRLIRNKWTYLFIALCSILLISSNVILAAVKAGEKSFPYADTAFSLSNFYNSLGMVFILCICVGSMVFGSEHTNHTMKNSISYGISRGNIYFGKLFVEIVYAMIAFAIITACHIGSAYLLLENSGIEHLQLLFKTCFVAFPLLLFALAATNCFIFIIESSGAGISAIVGVLIVIPMISKLLGLKFIVFRNLSKVLPWNMLDSITFDFDKVQLILPWSGASGYYLYWIIGIAEMALISIIGFVVFRKKEIK